MATTGEEIIARHREARRLCELAIQQKAAAVYATFDDNERTVVQFGMFPAGKMEKAELELLQDDMLDLREMMDVRDVGRLLAVGIMDAANASDKPLVV